MMAMISRKRVRPRGRRGLLGVPGPPGPTGTLRSAGTVGSPPVARRREAACPRGDAYGSEATGARRASMRRTAPAGRGDARRFGAVRLAVLVSGTGSILEAMLGSGLPVDLVGADRPCRGLGIAADAGNRDRAGGAFGLDGRGR